MRISELSEQTGVPVPTIKYYLREGLLPEGDKRTPRLTEYDDRHVRRLVLLRILRDVGDVPVDGLKRMVAATESSGTSVHELFAVAADALAPTPPAALQMAMPSATTEVLNSRPMRLWATELPDR